MRTRIRFTLLLLLVCTFHSTNIFGQEPPGFDRYVDSVLSIFQVPGLCVSIVKDGKLVLAKGYGIKHLGDTARVNEHTLFPIASNSKAFTAMALAILVNEGKLKWDAPVINYLPWFRMSDPWVTAQITVRDLLVHHSGIPAYAGDILLFPPSSYTRRQILEKLPNIPIVHSFRTTYAYDNILYAAAGEVITEVSGMEWQDFVRTRILEKAGMTETKTRFTSLNKSMNIATGHIRLQKKITPVEAFLLQDIGDAGDPAGGIATNAIDMAKWLITELDSGKAPNQVRLVPASFTQELWNIVTPIPIPETPAILRPAQFDFYGYALGVRVLNYGSYKTIGHGGKLDGFVSHTLLVPKLKMGIAVLTNQESGGAYLSIIYHLLDHYMQNPYYNWIDAYRQLLDSSQVEWQRDWNKAVITLVPNAPKPQAAEKYTGIYKDSFYGDISISKDAEGLSFQFNQTPQFTGKLTPLQFETFKATFDNPALRADGYLYFTLSPNGVPESCQLTVIDPASDISFDGLVFKKNKSK